MFDNVLVFSQMLDRHYYIAFFRVISCYFLDYVKGDGSKLNFRKDKESDEITAL